MKKLLLITTLLLSIFATLFAADFNHDGHQDYLLSKNSTRQLAIWHLIGPTYVSGVWGPVIRAGWTIVGLGDFNGDGYPDLLLTNTARQTAVWYLHDGTYLNAAYGPTFINGFVAKAVDDMDGDGKPDILAYNPNTRALWVILMNNNHIRTAGELQVSMPQVTGPQVSGQVSGMQEEDKAVNSAQVETSQFVLATIPPNWAIVESAQHQITLINTSTFQTANWVIGFNAGLPNPFFIAFYFYGPNVPGGWRLVDTMDFNLDHWNDYLLGGALGTSAMWFLDGTGHFLAFAHGPTIPTGFSFAQEQFKTCTYGVSPTAKTVGTTGGSFLVNTVTEFGCPWTWHSNKPWIHTSTIRTIYGTGAVFVTVDAGPAGVGSLTVAGQTVTVTRGANGILTGHWNGIASISDGCSNHMSQPDAHIVQTGSTLTGTWSMTLPCPCSSNNWATTGNITGTVSTAGAISIHVVGPTVAACGTSLHIDTTYTGFITPYTNNNALTLSAPGYLNPFQMNRLAQ